MPQLLNTLASPEQVALTPSRADGVPAALEEELRVYGCQLIQQAGILSKLPQVTMATAQVLFQRFWYVSSMKSFGIRDMCMGALFLASKLEETPRRLRDFINVFDYLLCRARHSAKHNPGLRSQQLRRARREPGTSQSKDGGRSEGASEARGRSLAERQHRSAAGSDMPPFQYKPMTYFASGFYDAKDALVIAEMQLLKRLGFQVQVNLPYATMINYLQLLGLTDAALGVAQHAWSVLNDALQTPVYVLFPPHIIAAASIYLASLTVPACPPLPLEPQPWWALFDVDRAELRIVCTHIMRLYDEAPADEYGGEDEAGEEILAGTGLARRVRDEHGGLVDFVDKAAVRDWLSRYGKSSAAGTQASSSTSQGRIASAESTPLRTAP